LTALVLICGKSSHGPDEQNERLRLDTLPNDFQREAELRVERQDASRGSLIPLERA
jgi:hypothetical protein